MIAPAFAAQPGSLDISFDADISENGVVYVIVPQLDGKILIGGAFESVAGVPKANIARLNTDGTLDPAFNPGTAVDVGFVTAIAVDPNGRILVGGTFNSSVYSNPANLARLNENGSVDSSFNPFLYIDGPVNAVAIPDED
ncbi:MAG TPA: delta-60 repeat domain-containing protein, partial [Candidatus Saccharimonadales bacterium]|nr:delta-60 repeat domain-containing protein [Candidatus Saccharimonadales bacterium]